MKSIATLLFCCIGAITFSQQATSSQQQQNSGAFQVSKKTFIISSGSNSPLLYNHIESIDINAGKSLQDIYEPKKSCSVRNNGYLPYQSHRDERPEDSLKMPMGGSVACMAYDYKSNRLFYIPLQLSELRYLDMKESNPSFTYLENQSLKLLHNKEDVANQITRMTIGSDGFGYALSNDGEHLIKFSTQETPTIQDLGVLIDNPKNQVLVRSSCTSWGGDMVGDVNGNLYLITVHNHIFKISLPSKKCDYVGTIKNLPEGFSSNGASVDENGELMVSCGASLGKKFSALYKINWPLLEAEPIGHALTGIGNISDMASSNLLFQKTNNQPVSNSVAAFAQTVETNENNLPNISIFPNPVNHGRFQIKTSNVKEKGEYKMLLLDITGQAIMEGKMNLGLKTNTNSFNFPVRHTKGVYVVQIADTFNRTIYSQQLIVE